MADTQLGAPVVDEADHREGSEDQEAENRVCLYYFSGCWDRKCVVLCPFSREAKSVAIVS